MDSGGEGLALVVRRFAGGVWHSLAGCLSPAGAGRHRALSDTRPRAAAETTSSTRARTGAAGRFSSTTFPARARFGDATNCRPATTAQRLGYDARFARSENEIVGLSDLPEFVTTFQGSGIFDRGNSVASGYVMRSLATRRPAHGGCGRAAGLGRPGEGGRGIAAHRCRLGADGGRPHPAYRRLRHFARSQQPGAVLVATRSAGSHYALQLFRSAIAAAHHHVPARARPQVPELWPVERRR